MRKKIIRSLLAVSLSTMLVFSSPFVGTTVLAETDDMQEGENLEVTVYATTDVAIDATNFPDEAFRGYVAKYIDKDENGTLSASEISACTSIDKCFNKGISDLTGIEIFYNLERLYCYGNHLTSLDLSKNTALSSLNCSNNELSNLEISKNASLAYLWCGENNLGSLDLSKNTALKELDCHDNNLTSLDVSNHKSLKNLDCSNNALSSLIVNNNTSLISLNCDENSLTSLEVSSNTSLMYLFCNNNNLNSLDVSKNRDLYTLKCSDNNLSNLDVNKNFRLTHLYCSYNKLENLDISKNTVLTSLDCSRNNLSNLNVSNNTELKDLYCWGNALSSVDTSNNKKLEEFVLLNTPVIKTPTIGSTGVNISWSNSIGAEGYYIYRRIKGNSSWERITNLEGENSLSYTDTNISYGKTYEYTVSGYYSDYESKYDDKGKSIVVILATPSIKSVSNVNGGVQINWGKVTGAAKYRVFYKQQGTSGWSKLTDTTATSYTWTGAKSGKTYTFTVRCLSSDGKNYTSRYDSAGKSITYIAAPKITDVSNVSTGVKISWGKVTGAEKYRVFYKLQGASSWNRLADTTSTSYTWTGAKSGNTYIFTVRCLSSDGKTYTSSYDSTGKSTAYIAAPKITDVSNVSTGVKISWGKVTGAEQYRVFYKVAGTSGWSKLTDTTSISYTWKGAKAGTKYTFTVRCLSGDGKTYTSSYDASGKTITYTGK